MWRSLFMALGAYVCIMGAECLIIDKAVLAGKDEPPAGSAVSFGGKSNAGRKREFVPPDWAPWSLMSAGAIAMLYSITLSKGAEKK